MHRSTYSTATTPAHNEALAMPVVPASNRVMTQARLHLMLLLGSAMLLVAPLAMFEPAAHWADDAELFTLLRGMACIKGMLALLAFIAVWWRFGQPLTARLAKTYIVGVWALALASGLIWQLTFIVAASGLFHLATIALLVAAWRDIEPRFEKSRFTTTDKVVSS